ncbi:MAG: cytochrome o ubiquinol oxidase subunit I [Alphaproteobacteria bacterium]
MARPTNIVTEPHWFFGKLNLDVFPTDPIVWGVGIVVGILGAALLGFITKKKLWGYLWSEWFTTVDHKKIAIMYTIVALVMLVRGFSDAILMRTHQALATSDSFGSGYLPPEHYDQIFTAHAVIMIFFVATPLVAALWNLVVPLQIGARDVAFPFLNNLSFWFFAAGAILINVSLFVGEFGNVGWLAYPPLSGIEYNPWVGVDYWIWSLQISGIGTTLTAVNFIATVLRMRAPGMTLMKMPIFIWTTLSAAGIAAIIFPILTVAIALLTMDRYIDTNFFTNELGGNQMTWVNLVWAWGHPEVYFLVLPAFGVFAELVPVFSRKKLFGYTGFVYATLVIMILSFLVWLHHFFTMGSGASVNAFFGIATMTIAIPTGVKIFNWLFTMYKGRVELSAGIYWTIAFLITFTVGGMTGVMLSIPAADFVLHNSLFLVAHFHNTIIGGAVFGYLAGITYWWPKATGFKLNETLGKWSAMLWLVGFFVAFMPIYAVGFMGATRRLNYYDNPDWAPYFIVAAFGVFIIAAGIGANVLNFVYSFLKRKEQADVDGDPWDGNTLEWSTSSPPPFYNFAKIPYVNALDDWKHKKDNGVAYQPIKKYERIHMPANTTAGPIIGVLSTVFGFAFIWHIWWLVVLTFVGMIATFIWHNVCAPKDYYVEIDEVKAIEEARMKSLGKKA